MTQQEETLTFGWPDAEIPGTFSFSENQGTLRSEVKKALELYFAQLDGQPVTNLYEMVLTEVEAPLMAAVMRYTGHNQSKASTLLGLNRGTLRKKLKQHGLL
ncbi:MAG: DNA-binding transcriptional regulator Fis [Pseudomonadota bacterium]|jgi:Fis family transcriptional regulator